MLRLIDKKNGKAIWKSSRAIKGAEMINFYGIRDVDANDKPFDSQHGSLREARESLDAA